MHPLRMLLAMTLMLAGTQATAKRSAQAAFAEPADIIAAEDNFARLNADNGLKAAIRATATLDAQRGTVEKAFANNVDVSRAMLWHTRELWMSCDGSIGVTHGDWHLGAETGWYVRIWQRQKGGAYKWLSQAGGTLKPVFPESDMISAKVADCPAGRTRGPGGAAKTEASKSAKAPVPDFLSGHSDDATLEWANSFAPNGSVNFVLRIKQDAAMHEVLRAIVAAGPAAPGT